MSLLTPPLAGQAADQVLASAAVARPVRLSYLHSFRAIALLLVVGGHCAYQFSWPAVSVTRDALVDALEDASVLFVFVSGFLFHHLMRDFRYGALMESKFKTLVIPYLIVSIPAVAHAVFLDKPELHYPWLGGMPRWEQALWFYAKGGAHVAYPLWYIPMIMGIWILSPALAWLKGRPHAYLPLLLVGIPLSMALQRPPFPNLETGRLIVYFLPCFIAGMAASEHRLRLERLTDRYWGPLAVLFAALLIDQIVLAPHHGNYETPGWFSFTNGPVDWLFLQKLLLCVVLIGVLRRFDMRIAGPLNLLGRMSFAVFFVHAYFLYFWKRYWHLQLPPGSLPRVAALTIGVVTASLLCALAVEKVMGRYSRYIIGSH